MSYINRVVFVQKMYWPICNEKKWHLNCVKLFTDGYDVASPGVGVTSHRQLATAPRTVCLAAIDMTEVNTND